MRKTLFLFLLIAVYGFVLFNAFPQTPAGEKPESAPPEAGYERVVDVLVLENVSPEQMREKLTAISRPWGIFPSLEFLPVRGTGAEKAALILRGRQEEVRLAKTVGESLDGIFITPSLQIALSPIPLVHLRAEAMREKLLGLARESGMALRKDQLLVFPPGPGGSLFYRGLPPDAKKVEELAASLDQPHFTSFYDSCLNFWKAFRKDAASHFVVISTYVLSALILILLHFLLIRLPGLGRVYERWFTLIWTKVLDNVKGRDFALEVIESIAETAVVSVEQQFNGEVKRGMKAAGEVRPDAKKERALSLAQTLLLYRGFKPEDPEVKRIIGDVIEAKVYELKEREKMEG